MHLEHSRFEEMDQKQTPTGIEAQVCEDIAARQRAGIAKYGVTVADNPLKLREWLQHAYEEILDQAVYIRRAIAQIDADTSPVVESVNDGWIPWSGGECPVDPETMIIVNMDWLGNSSRQRAGSLDWSVSGGRGDIIAYRLA